MPKTVDRERALKTFGTALNRMIDHYSADLGMLATRIQRMIDGGKLKSPHSMKKAIRERVWNSWWEQSEIAKLAVLQASDYANQCVNLEYVSDLDDVAAAAMLLDLVHILCHRYRGTPTHHVLFDIFCEFDPLDGDGVEDIAPDDEEDEEDEEEEYEEDDE